MHTKLRSERGQALLETAVILPIVLFVSVGIFEFGRAYQTWQVLTNAAREGARVAVLPGTQDSDVVKRVQDYVKSGNLSAPTTVSVVIDHTKTISIGTGTAPATLVTVNYPFSFIVLNPVAKLVNKSSTTGSAAFTMSTAAEMRNE